MIRAVAINNYKAIQYIELPELQSFHVLVGPNSSGKTTFLDVFDYIKDIMNLGFSKATSLRCSSLTDLTYLGKGGKIEFDFFIELNDLHPISETHAFHYHLGINTDNQQNIHAESEFLHQIKIKKEKPLLQVFNGNTKFKSLLEKHPDNNYKIRRETTGRFDVFKFGSDSPGIALTPSDETRYPQVNRIRQFLSNGIRYYRLSGEAMKAPCLFHSPDKLKRDGSNLAKIVSILKGNGEHTIFDKKVNYNNWLDHIRSEFQDIADIYINKRDEDNTIYLTLKYTNGYNCPTWLLSDGTLKLLALTIPAFIPGESCIMMFEEPENGVHPKALELIVSALSAIPKSQVFITTHSPQIIQMTGKEPLLCFTNSNEGVAINTGNNHPVLQKWEGTPELSMIFSSGLLG